MFEGTRLLWKALIKLKNAEKNDNKIKQSKQSQERLQIEWLSFSLNENTQYNFYPVKCAQCLKKW